MPKPIKKKDEVVEEDVIRRFVTFHTDRVIKETESEVSSKDKAAIVEMVVNYQGAALAELVASTVEMLLDSTDTEDGDDEEEEESEDAEVEE